jgi:hypothetical protein
VLNTSKEETHEVEKTAYLGRVKPDQFLFNNAVYVKGKGIHPVEDRYQVGKGAMNHNAENQANLREVVNLTEKLFPGQSWKIWGFAVATFFFESITNLLHFMPILFITGRKGTGKSRLAEFITALFCASRALKGMNFTSTLKSIYRTMAKYKACPVILNEYSGADHQNNFLLASYDLEGYNRAKTDQSLDVNSGEINSSLIVLSTQNIAGKEAEAVASRVVTINTDDAARDNEAFMEFRTLYDKMGAFIPHLFEHLANDEANLIDSIRDWITCNLNRYNADARVIETHTVFRACAAELFHSLGLNEFAGDELGVYIKEQEATINTHDYAKVFLTNLETLVRTGGIPDAYAKLDPPIVTEALPAEQTLIFGAVENIYPLVKKFCVQAQINLPDSRTIARLLSQAGPEYKVSRRLGRNQKTWFFKIQGGATSQDEENEVS